MLALLAGLLVGAFKVPAIIVFERMVPGTALGVLVGDGLYAWLALRLARRAGRDDVTAMPFGLDTPSSIGMAVLVLGPAFTQYRAAGLTPLAAGLETWHLGVAATLTMGALKLILAFAGRRVQRVVPRAGLLGALAGIALMLIGFLPLIEVMQTPVVGFVTLGLVLYALVAQGAVPLRMPGVLFAVLVGSLIYYGLGILHVAGMSIAPHGSFGLHLALPHADGGVLQGFRQLPGYLPLLLPFALLTVVGGVNNTESAKAAGDDYDVRAILLGEAVATLAAGLAGGVAQTTPYIGHAAYKQMGARAGYVALTGLFIGLGGVLGFLTHLIELIPLAVLAPVLVFISIEITVQAFRAVPERHGAAVAMCLFPSIARMLCIELAKPELVAPQRFAQLMLSPGTTALDTLVELGNGFILTATLWGAFVVEMIEGRLRAAAAFLTAGAVLCAFGIIHSVRADGSAYAPWQLVGAQREAALRFCGAYLTLAALLLLLSLRRGAVARPAS